MFCFCFCQCISGVATEALEAYLATIKTTWPGTKEYITVGGGPCFVFFVFCQQIVLEGFLVPLWQRGLNIGRDVWDFDKWPHPLPPPPSPSAPSPPFTTSSRWAETRACLKPSVCALSFSRLGKKRQYSAPRCALRFSLCFITHCP